MIPDLPCFHFVQPVRSFDVLRFGKEWYVVFECRLLNGADTLLGETEEVLEKAARAKEG